MLERSISKLKDVFRSCLVVLYNNYGALDQQLFRA